MQKSFPAPEVATATGSAPAEWERAESAGYGTNTAHWRVRLTDGRRAFVKEALDEDCVEWLRMEYRVYAGVRGDFLPRLLGWHDARVTLLAIEDLSDEFWPPPWRDGDIDAVLAALDRLHATPAPEGIPRLEELRERLNGWQLVAEDPEPLLSTGLCSREWLEANLEALLEAGRTCRLDGDDLLHVDVRSDNLCIRDGRAVFVDWNQACVGNGVLDLVAWAPSLRLEGGPEPADLVPNAGALAALVAGFFASRAGLPPPPTAPRVREFQRAQAEVALPWAARELRLAA